MRILFIGDVVGPIGLRMIKEKVNYFVDKYHIDFVIANGENATKGKGLIQSHYEQMINDGVDVITLGNHYNSKKEITKFIDRVDNLIRPANIRTEFGGVGSEIYDVDGVSIRVTNLLGVAFMDDEVNSPYLTLLNILEEEEPATIHIVDYHAEATGEKLAFAHAMDGKVSAVLGTHTHVQTRDYRILENGTAYISDVGMTGFNEGVIGCSKETVVRKLIYGENTKFTAPEEGKGVFSAVVMDFNVYNGKCENIFPIYFEEE